MLHIVPRDLKLHIFFAINMKLAISLAEHNDWKQTKIHLLVPLRCTNKHVVFKSKGQGFPKCLS